MNTCVTSRRNGWSSPEALQQAAARSEETGANMEDDIRRIRSHPMRENAGKPGTVFIQQANSPEAIRRHGELALLPAD